jgi:hypothetical protein
MGTATDLTVEHYQRREVKETITKYSLLPNGAFRALNGDDGWYKPAPETGKIQLTTSEDYDYIINKYRTLYATLDLLDSSVKEISEHWDDGRGAPEKPIGTLQDCLAFTLSVDIDSIKGPNGEDITTSSEIKSAVEDAGKFFVNHLREQGVSKSIHCLYSGGGIYVHLHHALFQSKLDWSPEEREQALKSLTIAFNILIADVSHRFFEQHPEHRSRVKFDQLNNQKRKFKVIFSIHKRLPLAVIPLDPNHIEIDFDKAKIPLSSETLAEGTKWYQEYDLGELPKVKELLEPYIEHAEEELRERKSRTGNYDIFHLADALPKESWPPCMRNILYKVASGRGSHRALAIFAAYLYQAGWPEDEAFALWKPLANKSDVESRIFDVWYGQMICPNCDKIQLESGGYPRVGLGGLGYCEPNKNCDTWPGTYGSKWILEESGSQFESEPPKEPPLTLAEIEALYKEDHEVLLEHKVLITIAQLSEIGFQDFCKKLKLDSIVKKILKGRLAELKKDETQLETFDPDILASAMAIATRGDPLKFMLNTFNKTHKGDRQHAKAQFIAFRQQSALNTTGIFET